MQVGDEGRTSKAAIERLGLPEAPETGSQVEYQRALARHVKGYTGGVPAVPFVLW